MEGKFKITYVRIIVAAIALGLLGRMAVPKAGHARIEDNTTQLIESLVEMRTSIAIYCSQHGNQLPPTGSFEEFARAMTEKVNGNGPYISSMPVNAFNGLDTVRFDGDAAGTNTAGWRMDTRTGGFAADNDPRYAGL